MRTGDKGRDKDGGEKSNFEPGSDVVAHATVLAEGCWGHLTGAALKALGLAADDPQVWALGVKEVWEVERAAADKIIHTLGWPLRPQAKYKEFGGSWIYGMNREGEAPRVSIGFVVGLDSADARLSVHDLLQEFKLHPLVRKILEGGKRVAWGAKAIPEGGYWAMPRLHAPGMVICGDAGGMVNVPKLKGVHYAIQSGMLAAETIYAPLKPGSSDFSGYEQGGVRLGHRQGPLRVAQHEAAVRQGACRRRRDHQRDGRHEGPLPGRPLGDAPRRREPLFAHRPPRALSEAGRQVHVRQALGRVPHRQRDARRRAEPHPHPEARAARGGRGVAAGCARPRVYEIPEDAPERRAWST